MIGLRGNQGGVVGYGFRLVVVAGVLTPTLDAYLTLDRQLGDDNTIRDGDGDPAAWYEWVASARVGRRLVLASDLWLVGAGGVALVNTLVASPDRTVKDRRNGIGVDVAAGLVWRSGPFAASVAAGLTAIPYPQTLAAGDARFTLPARVEPWFGLGVGLML
ncbi:MAG: hypothetical protein HS111_34025 [Kofleriaceae bacterium]|nr:hypothetical protein [Kofleriaceae bacterium]